MTRALLSEMKQVSEDNPMFSEEMRLNMINIDHPGKIADFIASILNIDKNEQQKLLETLNVRERMERVLVSIKKEEELLKIQKRVQTEINDKIEKSQREYFLKEELKAIKGELGLPTDAKSSDVQRFKEKIESFGFEGEIKEQVEQELEKFNLMDPNSSEFIVTRNWLDLVSSLPWKSPVSGDFDLEAAQGILENDHYGLKDVKDRIIEYLAVRKLKKDAKGSILCLVGPPGVGKTSVGRSIARAMGKEFFRFSVGGSAQVGLHGNSYLEGNLAYLKMRSRGDRPGGMIRFVQPVHEMFAFTAEFGYNETLVNQSDSGRVVVGVQMGSFIHPKDYRTVTSPVPMDVPRVRYELLTRRIGNSPPVADAGPDQIGVPAGSVTLNGSGSSDPDGDTLTYRWTQIAGPGVAVSGMNTATATFTAAAGQSYSFRLTVTDPGGMQSSGRTTVTTTNPPAVRILQFTAAPNGILAGERVRLNWIVENADTVTISPAPGSVDSKAGTADVTPAQTTTYTLTAKGAGGTVTATAVVTIQTAAPTNPRIIRFEATPVTILQGEASSLAWTTEGGTEVTISGIGSVEPNGSRTVSPVQTTTYTMTVRGSDGRQVTAPVTVTVTAGQVPQVVQFVASPSSIDAGGQSSLCWQVSNATSIDIAGVGSGLQATDCATVSPGSTTTYSLTARNGAGQIQANVTVNVGSLRILSFTSDPVTSTSAGDPVRLMWTTQGATSVVITGNFLPAGTLPANGSVVVKPTTNSTYTLIAYGPGGQQISAVISVFVR